MRSMREIEGTWEEILTNANEFSGKRVRLTLLEQEPFRASDLLKEINIGLSADTWTEYHLLISKRQAETLTDEEQQKLIKISDRLEFTNVRRMKALIELATLRDLPLDTVMQELGILESHSMAEITAQQKNFITQRAQGCCEYCWSQLKFSPDSFSIEHIIP